MNMPMRLPKGFEFVNDGVTYFSVIYDVETRVMYSMPTLDGCAIGVLTPLLNADGTPKLYRKEEEKKEEGGTS